VSLFAGIGGIDLALHRAGWHVAATVEKDPAARGVIAHHWPAGTHLHDVTEVTGHDLRTAGFVARGGLLAAGWPCQGNSSAGRRKGMDDPRSGLWAHVVRLLDETHADWFLGENVPGLLTVNHGADFATVLGDLADLGMDVCWRVLDAQFFGVPQRRRRVFLVGHRGDDRGPVRVLLEPDSGPRHPHPRRTAGTRPTARAGRRTPRPGSPTGVLGDIAHSLTAEGVGTCGADDNQAQAGHLLTFQRVVRSGARDHNGNLPPDVWAERPVAATLSPHDLGSDTRTVELITFRHQAGAKAGATIDETVSDGIIVRRLTPRECERLQGFPDDWTAIRVQQTGRRAGTTRRQADSPRYQQLGNAVAVPVAEWVARRITTEAGR
jgi:DNA (cytosine-5)-methyltransferase 1